MSVPRVSVIMNVRNGALYIQEALESVLAQTFTDWELVIWDNKSGDTTGAIVAGYEDPRIRYFRSPEMTSLGTARKLALRKARGEWVAFLDHDDIWLPHKLAVQLEIADEDGEGRIGLIYGRTVEFFPNGRQRDFDKIHEFKDLPEGNLFEEFFRKACFVANSSTMLRRSALERIGEIPPEYELISDFYLFIAVSRFYEARAIEEVVCRYRRHTTNLSLKMRREAHHEAFHLLEKWATDLKPEVAAHARRTYHTAIAIAEILRLRSLPRGILRALTDGSAGYILSRPFARWIRRLRGRFGRPRWRISQQNYAVKRGGSRVSATPSPLTLSIVVVNWKVRELLRDCLASIHAHMKLPAESWEVIVIDNASDDGSVEMVSREFPEAVLIANRENLGFAKANNQALPHCRGRYVLLLNPDVVLLDSALDRMVDILESRPEAGVLGCRLINPDFTLQKWTAGAPPGLSNVICHFLFLNRILPTAILPSPLILENEPKNDALVGWVSGACMLLRREALGRYIFDERFFMYGEDLHLCQMLSKAGWDVLYTPRSQVVHYGSRSIDNQTAEVQLTKLINLREVFAIRNGPISLVFFDLVVSVGFFLRLILFGLAARTRPGRGYDIRAEKSRRFLAETVRIFGSR